MRSSKGPEALLRASKKPHIQALVARAPSMSESEIQALDEKPDTKRGLLAIRQEHLHGEAWERAQVLADAMIAKYHPNLL